MSSTGQDSGAVNELLAASMALGSTVAEAARRAGVSTSTARRRLALPEVAERVTELTHLATTSAVVDLAGELDKSIRFLASVRDGTAAGSSSQLWARLQAATTLANLAVRQQAPPEPEKDPATVLAERLGEVLSVWSQPAPEEDSPAS